MNAVWTRRLCKEDEACAMLTVGRTKLRELTDAGEIVCVHIGRNARWDTASLDAYVQRLIGDARGVAS